MSEYIELLVTLGFLAALMWGMMKFMLRDILKEIHGMHNNLQDIHKDLAEIKSSQKKSDERIDHLYQICIEMLGTRHKH